MPTQTRHKPGLTRATCGPRGRVLGWLCALLIGAGPLPASAQSFSVQDVRTTLQEGVYRLDARLLFELPGKVREALENGVPLTFALDIEVSRPRRYLWNDDVAHLEQRSTLQYFDLTEQYLLRNLNSGHTESYSSLEYALLALGNIRSLPIIDAELLDPEQHYMVGIRSYLDIDSLPVPLRMRAYVSRDWWLTSGWFTRDLGIH